MKTRYVILDLFLLLLMNGLTAFSQNFPLYRDATKPIEMRVADLLSRMTQEEKFRQLFMIPGGIEMGREKLYEGMFGFSLSTSGQTGDAAGQLLTYGSGGSAAQMAVKANELQRFMLEESRLGIPLIIFDEALHGLIREGATAFPQAIGLAASFDTALMGRVAGAIASESQSRGIRQILSPVLNIARDVRWGRTEETYGEDPYLVSLMGAVFTGRLESAGIVATPKHFAVNSGDGGRDSYPVHYNERLLEEIYFPAFKTSFITGKSRSVMTAYNSLDGSPCTASQWLLNDKLRGEWGFRGFVISDACAVGGANVLHMTAHDYDDAGKQAISNGLDVIFQTDFSHLDLFRKPFIDGSLDQRIIDSAVARVLKVKFELGLFENPYVDPQKADEFNGCRAHREIALQAARESIVLLKNDLKILPIAPSVRKIAVIGTDATEARLGGYSGPGNDKISMLDGIRAMAPEGTEVLYHPGCGREDRRYETIPARFLSTEQDATGQQGLLGCYFANIGFEGEPVMTRTDRQVDFHWALYGPGDNLHPDWYSVRWTGWLRSPGQGKHRIGVEGNNGYRIYLDGKLIIDQWRKGSYGVKLIDYDFEENRSYHLKLEFYESVGNGKVKLIWDAGVDDTLARSINQAAVLAQKSEMVIVVAGIEEGEFRDRSSLALPGRQEEMIRSLAATGKPVVVLISGGSAVTMSRWIDQVQAVVEVWYPGEAGGAAVAEVLFGRYNPAGRLPVTFAVTEGQLPLVYNHKPTGRGDDYLDLTGRPLFPFGFGLSYTEFSYHNLKLDQDTIRSEDSVQICFTLKNSGTMAGDEVWQLYLRDELSSVVRPVRELKRFGRVQIQPGETVKICTTLDPKVFQMLDKNLKIVTEPGTFRIMVGASSGDIRLRGELRVREIAK
jgi:beta-glucosidase